MGPPRHGSQEPTFTTVGTWHHTFGPQVTRMFEGWGVRFYPCQRDEMDVLLARDARNRFACRTIGITKPRQNGKSFAARFYAIHCAAVEGRHVLFTAHRGSTVRKMFKFMRMFVLHTTDLYEKLLPGADGIYKAAGAEGIYFANGGMVEFATRTEGGGRGETYDIIFFDEAQELTDDQYDAVMPTSIASESGNPQTVYLGTPPGPKCRGTVFRALHDKVHAGGTEGIWWLEWSVTDIPDMSDHLAVLELAYRTNPALGYRIKEDVMLSVIQSATSADGFAREYLNWWSDVDGVVDHPILAHDWSRCLADEPPDGTRTFAVRFSPSDSFGIVAVCAVPEAGRPHVEVVGALTTSGGLAEMAGDMARMVRAGSEVVVDGRGLAQAFREQLLSLLPGRRDAARVLSPSLADVTAAYAGFASAVAGAEVTHAGQPQLTASATQCARRQIGNSGGFGFESWGAGDAAYVEAAALAHWRACQLRRTGAGKRKARYG